MTIKDIKMQIKKEKEKKKRKKEKEKEKRKGKKDIIVARVKISIRRNKTSVLIIYFFPFETFAPSWRRSWLKTNALPVSGFTIGPIKR